MATTRSRLSVLTTVVTFILSAFSASPVLGQATLENPASNSLQSGIGIISGWACNAGWIEIEFNGGPPVEAAYGTSRDDTHSTCGDTDNGFGLPVNWNLLGNGSHTVRALADGVEFANVTVTVTTLGVEFVRGITQVYVLDKFPDLVHRVVVEWQESTQNFVITGRIKDDGTVVECGRTPLKVGTMIFYAKCQERKKICLMEQRRYEPFGYNCTATGTLLDGPIQISWYHCIETQKECEQHADLLTEHDSEGYEFITVEEYRSQSPQDRERCQRAPTERACMECGRGGYQSGDGAVALCFVPGLTTEIREEDERCLERGGGEYGPT